jgi:hypothetical protein
MVPSLKNFIIMAEKEIGYLRTEMAASGCLYFPKLFLRKLSQSNGPTGAAEMARIFI